MPGNRGSILYRRSAFSLVELLIVLVILAVLAALVVPKLTNRSKQARNAVARTDVAVIVAALDTFALDNGRFPTAEEGLGALLKQPTNTTNWQGPYLPRGIPVDPWGNAYVYRHPGTHAKSGYDLYSFGPDGRDGGEDDVTSWVK